MNSKEQQAKQEAAKKPGPHDLHEQREQGQKQEGAVAPQLPTTPSTNQNQPPRRSGAV